MSRVTIVGSGNAFNSDGRAHACYLIDSSETTNPGTKPATRILMDVGATSLYRLQQLNIAAASIDAILLTHFHGDHYAGLPFVLLQMDLVEGRQHPLEILGPPGVQQACETIIEACYPGFEFHFPIVYRELDARAAHITTTQCGDFQIVPYPIEHKTESTGYRLLGADGGSLAFSGDSGYDGLLAALVDGVDLALIELTMPEQYDPPIAHVALNDVREQTNGHQLNAKRLVFTHITDALAREIENAGPGTAAYDGLVLEF